MTRAALALAVILAAGDYALTIPGEPPVCAKSAETCEAARTAIAQGWLPPIPPNAETSCAPSPRCFSERENCIPGYAGARVEGHCR